MPSHTISAAKLIPALPQKVYALIADYAVSHPRILPKPPFVSLRVEKGGVGAGTHITFQMRVMGQLRTFRAEVSEPEPGRVLAETDLDTGAVTTFAVEPQENGRHSLVTIATHIQIRAGFLGKVEGWLATQLLRPTYEKELAQLAALVLE